MPRAKDPTSKSQRIREYRATHPDASAREIQQALAKDGVKVAVPLIYNVISVDKHRRKGPVRNGNTAARSNQGDIALAALFDAKKLIDTAGSIEEAKRALDTLAKIS